MPLKCTSYARFAARISIRVSCLRTAAQHVFGGGLIHEEIAFLPRGALKTGCYTECKYMHHTNTGSKSKRRWASGQHGPPMLAYAAAAGFGACSAVSVGLALHAPLVMLLALSAVTVVVALAGFIGASRESVDAWVESDAHGVHRVNAGVRATLIDGDNGGICVLVNCARTRGAIVFTTTSTTRYIGFDIASAREGDRHIVLERAAICADLELEELALGNTLPAGEAADLLVYLKVRYPLAYGRLCSRGPSGERVVVSSHTIEIGDATFDLSAPLQWKSGTFFEWMGNLTRLFQATTLRQGNHAVAFVCPMPTELSVGPDAKLVAADLALVQAPTQTAPRGHKVALERLYMLHLRTILSQAPLAELAATSISRVQIPRESSRHLA